MSMDYIRDTYRVPAQVGGRVLYTGDEPPRHGTITGTRNQYLAIRLDGEKAPRSYHPTWELTYLATPGPQP